MRLAILALLLLSTPLPAGAEWFFEAFGGRGINLDTDLDLSQPALRTDLRYRDVAWEDRSFEPSPYYGYRVGVFLESRPWLGLRLQFLHHKAIARTVAAYQAEGTLNGGPVSGPLPLNGTVQWLEVTHGLNMVTLAAMARASFHKGEAHPKGRTQAYAGLGTGPVIAHVESTVRGANHETPYKLQSRPALEAFVGLRRFLTKRWLGLLEYKATRARVSAEVAGGRAAIRFTSHHLTFGLGLSF